jgi:dolichol kinase
VRKWLYAAYVYICVLAIILIGIREYVGRFALHENEPVGWALGYLFGDLPQFRMEVVTANLQRWICLPARSSVENEESCHLGWVEHLRHSSFGEANTRLILCAYWLGIIVVGLAVVFRLSAVYEVDTRRKVFHFMMVAMLLPATYVDPTFAALALSLMLAIFLILDLFRASQLPPLSKSLAYFLTPYVDGRDLKGPVVISHIFLLVGCAIPLWLSLGYLPRAGRGYLSGWEVPRREVSMVSGVICVGMGDAAASLIGRRYGRHKWIWGGGKSIEGSVAFATAVGLALILAKAWLRIGRWPANNDDSWIRTIGKAGIAAWVASLTEAVLTGGNDNVVVPVVLWLCV